MIKTINNQTTKKEKKLRIKTLKYKKAIVVQRENFLKADEKKIIMWRSICSFVLYLNETVTEHCVPNVSVIGILLRNIMILKKCFVFRYIKKEKEKKNRFETSFFLASHALREYLPQHYKEFFSIFQSS